MLKFFKGFSRKLCEYFGVSGFLLFFICCFICELEDTTYSWLNSFHTETFRLKFKDSMKLYIIFTYFIFIIFASITPFDTPRRGNKPNDITFFKPHVQTAEQDDPIIISFDLDETIFSIKLKVLKI